MTPSELTRFWKKVDKTGACWVWTASLKNGYGWLMIGGRAGSAKYAHRLAYEHFIGPIASGLHVDHTCWNRRCVNPAHLQVVSQALNNQNLSGARASSSSGIRGVHWVKAKSKYRAEARVNGYRKHLGYFSDPIEAGKVVRDWRRAHMPNSIADRLHQIQDMTQREESDD